MTNKKEADNNYMQPLQYHTLKYFYDLLKDRYGKHDEMLQRITHNMPKTECEKFIKMAVDLYEIGYKKAVSDYQGVVEKYGIKINIVPTEEKV